MNSAKKIGIIVVIPLILTLAFFSKNYFDKNFTESKEKNSGGFLDQNTVFLENDDITAVVEEGSETSGSEANKPPTIEKEASNVLPTNDKSFASPASIEVENEIYGTVLEKLGSYSTNDKIVESYKIKVEKNLRGNLSGHIVGITRPSDKSLNLNSGETYMFRIAYYSNTNQYTIISTLTVDFYENFYTGDQ